jgi:hypothetical protein
MEQAKRKLPTYLRGVRPIEGRLLALLDLDDQLCSHGRGRNIDPDVKAELDREVARMCREIIQARWTREHFCGAPIGRRG